MPCTSRSDCEIARDPASASSALTTPSSRRPSERGARTIDVDGRPYRTIWVDAESSLVSIIDQRRLPFEFRVEDIESVEDMADAILDMRVRGAGCIGAAAAFGMYLAAVESERAARDERRGIVERAGARLKATRPTAVNLAWAVDRQIAVLAATPVENLAARARQEAERIADDDVDSCRRIGDHGLSILAEIHRRTNAPVNILTHCNAGWLAFVDRGTATAPIYAAHESGIPVHVWVTETRPLRQGARLTTWELAQSGVPHTLVVDGSAGHLLRSGLVDIVIVGSDRTTRRGDVANKVGTYAHALAAVDNRVPFYVALPSSSIDWTLENGSQVPIEERDPREVTEVDGWTGDTLTSVRIAPPGVRAANYAFDVTPSRLVTGLITERGITRADESGLLGLYPEHRLPLVAS